MLRGKIFKPQQQIVKDCNTCTCENGSWKCTDVTCGARCGAIGDPHYITFDGKRYDFMGKCSYHLMKTENISIEAENVACPGSISQALRYLLVIFPEIVKLLFFIREWTTHHQLAQTCHRVQNL